MSKQDDPLKKNGDPRSPAEISADHFYQLVLMDERSRQAWLRYLEEPSEGKQDELASKRKKLLQQKEMKKKEE